MARSHNIYIASLNHNILAAFTVKHELKSWLQREYPRVPSNLRIERLPDGGRGKYGVDVTAKTILEMK